MENASKALIMAGAILIALAIISLSVFAFTNYKKKVDENNSIDKQAISAFNSKILPYTGDNVKGTDVNAMLQEINALNHAEKTFIVEVWKDGNLFLDQDGFKGAKKLPTTDTFKIEASYNKFGCIDRVDIN